MKIKMLLAIAAFAAAPAMAQQLHAFGDSITVGVGASVPDAGYAQLVAKARNMKLDDRAVSSSEMPDMAAQVYGFRVPADSSSIWLPGYNDMRQFGMNVRGFQTYRNGLMALAAWLAIPEASKQRAQNAASSGRWSASSMYGGDVGRYSAGRGDSLTFGASGTVVYVAGTATTDPVGGILGVAIDGRPMALGYCYGSASPVSGLTYSPFLLRIPGLRPGPHEVVITVESTAGTTFVDWVAGNDARGPRLYLGNTLPMTQEGYRMLQGFDHGSDAAAKRYSEAAREVASILTGDGLDVVYVDAGRYYFPDGGDSTLPDMHPNDHGHAAIARAFLEAMP